MLPVQCSNQTEACEKERRISGHPQNFWSKQESEKRAAYEGPSSHPGPSFQHKSISSHDIISLPWGHGVRDNGRMWTSNLGFWHQPSWKGLGLELGLTVVKASSRDYFSLRPELFPEWLIIMMLTELSQYTRYHSKGELTHQILVTTLALRYCGWKRATY